VGVSTAGTARPGPASGFDSHAYPYNHDPVARMRYYNSQLRAVSSHPNYMAIEDPLRALRPLASRKNSDGNAPKVDLRYPNNEPAQSRTPVSHEAISEHREQRCCRDNRLESGRGFDFDDLCEPNEEVFLEVWNPPIRDDSAWYLAAYSAETEEGGGRLLLDDACIVIDMPDVRNADLSMDDQHEPEFDWWKDDDATPPHRYKELPPKVLPPPHHLPHLGYHPYQGSYSGPFPYHHHPYYQRQE
jgi:hypothetical protein